MSARMSIFTESMCSAIYLQDKIAEVVQSFPINFRPVSECVSLQNCRETQQIDDQMMTLHMECLKNIVEEETQLVSQSADVNACSIGNCHAAAVAHLLCISPMGSRLTCSVFGPCYIRGGPAQLLIGTTSRYFSSHSKKKADISPSARDEKREEKTSLTPPRCRAGEVAAAPIPVQFFSSFHVSQLSDPVPRCRSQLSDLQFL